MCKAKLTKDPEDDDDLERVDDRMRVAVLRLKMVHVARVMVLQFTRHG